MNKKRLAWLLSILMVVGLLMPVKSTLAGEIATMKEPMNNQKMTTSSTIIVGVKATTGSEIDVRLPIECITLDVDNNGIIDIADLAIISYYYRLSSVDSNWEEVKKADVNQDGIIDQMDLTIVAEKIRRL